MGGYGDLYGINKKYLEEAEKYKPFINFIWDSDINESGQSLLSRKDYSSKGVNNILGARNIRSIDEVLYFYNKGVRAFGFNKEIDFDDELIRNINNLNIIIDTIDLGDESFNSFLEIYEKPIIITSGNIKEVCKYEKNIRISKLRRIHQAGGIVGINLNIKHLTEYTGRNNSLEAILNHIDYIIDKTDENTVCFGCGFGDSNILPWEVQSPKDMKVIEHWLEVYYGEVVKDKIMYKNIARIIKDCL